MNIYLITYYHRPIGAVVAHDKAQAMDLFEKEYGNVPFDENWRANTIRITSKDIPRILIGPIQSSEWHKWEPKL